MTQETMNTQNETRENKQEYSDIKVSKRTEKVLVAMAALDELHAKLSDLGGEGVLDPYVESLETIEGCLERTLIGTIYSVQPDEGPKYKVI